MKELTHARLLELLHYDPETGLFTRRQGGGEPGCLDRGNGYRKIGVQGTRYLAHRLAWFYVHGVWPAGQIDHLNRVRMDNRLANLRDVSPAENGQNRPLARGARWDPSHGKWHVQISVGNRNRHVGRFDDEAAARAAYLAAKRELHPGFIG